MPKPTRSFVLVFALAVALAGAACTMAGPNFERPEAPGVAGYAMAGDASPPSAVLSPDTRAAGPWWTALGSAELDLLIRTALADSPDLAYAEANLRSALAEAGAVRGAELPQADLEGGAGRTRVNTQTLGFTGFPSPTINLYQLGLSGRYDLDIFGKKRRATEAATARAEAEARRADGAYLTLSANVALQAVRIATLRAQIASISAAIEGDLRVIDMIARAQAAGGAPRSASSIGETQLAQDQAQLPPLERRLAEGRNRMALLLGKSPGEWTAPDFELSNFIAPPAIPVAIPSLLVRKRPDILAAEAAYHAATADIGLATASLYPDLVLTANILQGATMPEGLLEYGSSGWTIATQLAGPLFRGGALKARETAAIAKADAALADYRRTVIKAFVQVADVLAGLAADERHIAALERAEAAAQANFADAQRSYELGAGALLNVFDAGRQLNLARRQKVEAQGQKLEDIIELFAATAADWR